ncbi:HPt (histidine-containing phosphotransfer) domain-containing protein [Achromobacter deleyi]|jgi:HPt (histidine-containing phosphotransfer) domain-containing protein|nr:HPt (histidine-containing phosphotransfer) domain-containing protein [Achromobacter deleyi]
MLTDLTSADPCRIRTLANAFTRANDQDLLQLRTLHADQQRTGLSLLAHRIKGAAQMTGDAQLGTLCAELERICSDPTQDAHALDACVWRLESALEEFGDSFRQIAQGA